MLPYLALIRLARKTPNLSRTAPVTGPTVSVIIPARNESAAIEQVVRSILASTYLTLEVIVVDDRSDDDTAAIAVRIAATDPRLTVIRGGALPEGWYGKPWACLQGYRAARGAILLFTDADTRHAPELIARAVGAAAAANADLLTVAPHQECVSFWERIIMPQVWILLGLRYHPDTVNRARHARDVIANGQFIMVRREAYEEVGTHEIVRREVVEDLALAQAFWRAGKVIRFAFAETLMTTRMYTNLREIIEGWSKNIYLGGRRSYPDEPILRALVPVTLSVAMLFWLLPLAALALQRPAGLLPAAWLAAILSLGFWSLVAFGMRIPAWFGFGYPLGALMTLYIILRSTLRGRTRVEWKGRTYGAGMNRG
jgi:chlorobactene glucosyltransferase